MNKIPKKRDKELVKSLARIHRMLMNADRNKILEELRKDRDERR